MDNFDVVIIGAGAAGLMCAIEAGKRGRKVLVIDHANKAGKKILMSGGGRCNFTNYSIEAENYISSNPHFCKSALSRFNQWHFLELINQYQIPFHARAHGQLFCDHSAKDILAMLLSESNKNAVSIELNSPVKQINTEHERFIVQTSRQQLHCQSLVIATGGLSIPKMGATPFGYQVAEQFGIAIIPTRAGLVPFTWQDLDKIRFTDLSGIAVAAVVSNETISFEENLLFTHRGLSGPAILQISSYWNPGETIEINLLPDLDLFEVLLSKLREHSNSQVGTVLTSFLPKKLIRALCKNELLETPLQNCSDMQINQVVKQLQQWIIKPNATEGYRTAEVTVGGVSCDEISSKTLESTKVKGLYFVGEVLDVTGWLGGYNFQWAWSSGWCAGQFV